MSYTLPPQDIDSKARLSLCDFRCRAQAIESSTYRNIGATQLPSCFTFSSTRTEKTRPPSSDHRTSLKTLKDNDETLVCGAGRGLRLPDLRRGPPPAVCAPWRKQNRGTISKSGKPMGTTLSSLNKHTWHLKKQTAPNTRHNSLVGMGVSCNLSTPGHDQMKVLNITV